MHKLDASGSTSASRLVTQLGVTAACAALAYYVRVRNQRAERALRQALANRIAAMQVECGDGDDSSSSNESSEHGQFKCHASRRLTSVVVRVPATTANMGPGFDTIGMALDIWTEISVDVLPELEEGQGERIVLTTEGEGAKELPTDGSNLVVIGMKAAFRATGSPFPTNIKIHCKNRIPFARGLGSSSAGIVGGIVAGLAIAGKRLSVRGREELLQLASEIEGHPDNVAPAIYGGLQLGFFADDRWYSSRVRVPHGLQCIVFIPDSTGPTSVARAILPKEISRKDAVFNIGRAAVLVNAFNTGRLEELRFATQDMLHQPQRGKEQYPHLFPLMQAALDAGAHGCFLSGAGPTVLAITSGRAGDIFTQRQAERQENRVADAMRRKAADLGVSGCVFITNPEDRGAYIARATPSYSSRNVARYEGDVADL